MLLPDMDLLTTILVFFAYIAIDGLYVIYLTSISRTPRPVTAATTGIMIHLIAAFGVINYVHNKWYLIPLVMGSWLGTYLMMLITKERDNRKRHHTNNE